MNLIETITAERDKLNTVLDILTGADIVLPGDLAPAPPVAYLSRLPEWQGPRPTLRGRPPKNPAAKRKRGRPKGSKNRDTVKPVVDAIVKTKKHWTQTPEGRARQAKRAKKQWAAKTGFAKKGGRK
jgi:hypothetical protein